MDVLIARMKRTLERAREHGDRLSITNLESQIRAVSCVEGGTIEGMEGSELIDLPIRPDPSDEYGTLIKLGHKPWCANGCRC